ncbi:MAG: CIA30 family protein [Steroidobacteraceae bacterium]
MTITSQQAPEIAVSQPAESPSLDFSRAEVVRTFWVVNDGVMGGVSSSRLRPAPGAMLFEGEVSLENNGGFASFRGPVRFPTQSAALLLTVRGDGRRYRLTLKLVDDSGAAQYQAAFVAPPEWATLRFHPTDFAASFRGRAVAAPVVSFADVRYVGLLIADKQSGRFNIELKSIASVAGVQPSPGG